MPWHNGPILSIANIIKFVMSSVTEAKLAAMLITAKKIAPLRQTLIEMCWPQTNSLLQTDNSTAAIVSNNTIMPRQTKDMGMRFY